MASDSPDAEVYTLDDWRECLEALAQEFDHRVLVCRRAREVTDSLYQRERLRGKEQSWAEAARIARQVVPRDEG